MFSCWDEEGKVDNMQTNQTLQVHRRASYRDCNFPPCLCPKQKQRLFFLDAFSTLFLFVWGMSGAALILPPCYTLFSCNGSSAPCSIINTPDCRWHDGWKLLGRVRSLWEEQWPSNHWISSNNFMLCLNSRAKQNRVKRSQIFSRNFT